MHEIRNEPIARPQARKAFDHQIGPNKSAGVLWLPLHLQRNSALRGYLLFALLSALFARRPHFPVAFRVPRANRVKLTNSPNRFTKLTSISPSSYALLFGQMDIVTLFIFLSAYSQAMFTPLYTATQGNHYTNQAFHNYSNYLPRLIPKCRNVQVALKLQTFCLVHQPENKISYSFHRIFYFSSNFLLTYILESGSYVLLLFGMLNL